MFGLWRGCLESRGSFAPPRVIAVFSAFGVFLTFPDGPGGDWQGKGKENAEDMHGHAGSGLSRLIERMSRNGQVHHWFMDMD